LFALWLRPQLTQAATTVYTNEADFVAAIGTLPAVLNEFTNSAYFGWLAHPIQVYTNAISYWIASQPPVRLVGFDGALSTHDTNDEILVTFTSSNVAGVGGYFYAADNNAAPVSGSVLVRLSDGTEATVASSTGAPPSFVGFLSDGPILTNLVVTDVSATAYPALSHLYVVEGIPSPSITLLAPPNLMISWYSATTGFVLQTCPDLNGNSWTNVNWTPQLTNNQFQVVLPRSDRMGFFRLVKP
jgi:hypothetical protein